MSSIEFTVSEGTVRANLAALGPLLREKAGRALRQEAEIEMTEAKQRTPVDTGALRASGLVEGPVSNGDAIEVTLSFGGPSAPYAVAVHENLEAFHPHGQAKFLESVILESASSLGDRLAARIRLTDAI